MGSLKFAVVGKLNHLYWDSHVVSALKELGHAVFHFQINKRPLHVQFARGVAKGVMGDQIGNTLTNRWHAKLLAQQLEKFRPDVVFYVSGMFIPIEYYEIINSLSFKPTVIAWDGDSGVSYECNKKYVSYIDIVFQCDKFYCKNNLLGFKKVEYLPFGANEVIFRDLHREREHKIYFCGAWTPERDELISKLTDFPLVLKGWNWNNLSKKGKHFEVLNKQINIDCLVKDYNKYSIVLNKHQTAKCISAFGINMRTFEVPACGALLLNDWRDDFSELYVNGEEIAVYKNTEELQVLCDMYLSDINKAREVASSGHNRTLREHTYKHRMNTLLQSL